MTTELWYVHYDKGISEKTLRQTRGIRKKKKNMEKNNLKNGNKSKINTKN